MNKFESVGLCVVIILSISMMTLGYFYEKGEREVEIEAIRAGLVQNQEGKWVRPWDLVVPESLPKNLENK